MLMFRIDRRIITCTCKLYSFYGKAKEFIACTIHNVNLIFSVMPGWLFVNVVAGKRDYSNCAIKLLTMIFKMAKSALMLMFRIDRRIITCTCKLYSFYGKAKEFIACTIHNVNLIFSVMPGWLFVNVVAGKRDYSNCAIKLLTMIFKMAKSALKSHLESNRIKKELQKTSFKS